ncbi:hypothetical protein L1276_004529 [Flavobacterium sp. HSC-32F16]|uniref:hypothetical protein n=1 Tax=Flavobacterium sp. HSC-32F16 TaxID=2910964 RepID=UPI0020A29518|nr:hypothetical protein [Flavobacterium sp. HSC-32F16]MCP2029345.1 hypothetical protein [Flavobacterium sp. HSC-32F16]
MNKIEKINLIILLSFSLTLFAQNASDKIKSFENDLNQWNKSKNKKWTLKERMSFYEVNAVTLL